MDLFCDKTIVYVRYDIVVANQDLSVIGSGIVYFTGVDHCNFGVGRSRTASKIRADPLDILRADHTCLAYFLSHFVAI
jgi:hypothetical protein